MTVSLIWQGPFGVNAIPRVPLFFENLCQPGVYLRVKTYDNGRLVVYVGQSASLLARFDQHLSSMLALATPLRDPSGAVIFSADAGVRLEAFKDLDRYSSLACDDVRRVLFFYALCDNYFQIEHLDLVEALLQGRIQGRLDDIENAISAPSAIQDNLPDRWKNDLSALEQASRGILLKILGDDLISLDPRTGNAI